MQLTIVGSGDAFGSGGRLQTCFYVESAGEAFLIDCGVTALIGCSKLGLDPNKVSTIFISHLHGDHFGGLIWWVLHARFVTKRTTPLVVVGPKGLAERYQSAGEAFYPGAFDTAPEFPLSFLEYDEAAPMEVSNIRVSVKTVCHPSGAPSYALRVESAGKVLSYSGDTEWIDGLIDVAHGADLFICECFGYDEDLPYHLNWTTLKSKFPDLNARSILLTHMGETMLKQAPSLNEPRISFAHDGLKIDI